MQHAAVTIPNALRSAASGGGRADIDLVGVLPAIVWESDVATSTMVFVSPRSLDILGYDPDQWCSEPEFWERHLHPDDAEQARAAAGRAIETSEPTRIQYRFRAADGTDRWFSDSIQVITTDDGGRRLVGVMVDVTDEHLHREALEAVSLRESAGDAPEPVSLSPLHQSIIDNLSDGVYYVDRERQISYWNRGAERLTGYRAADVVGKHCYDNILCHVDADGRALCHLACPLLKTMHDGHERQALIWLRHADGHRVPVETRTASVMSPDASRTIGGVEIFSDATGLLEARDAADAARHDALTDPLTGLPNRRLLDAILTARKDDLDRHRLPFGFLMVDIDHFKLFNDRYGHDVGDQALRVVGNTLKGGLRSGDTLVRWGGEEFAIVAAQVDIDAIARLAERLLHLMRATRVPVGVEGVPVRVSIGGALARPGEALDELFARSDRALLAAKRGGRDRFVLNEPPTGAAAGPMTLGAGHRMTS